MKKLKICKKLNWNPACFYVSQYSLKAGKEAFIVKEIRVPNFMKNKISSF